MLGGLIPENVSTFTDIDYVFKLILYIVGFWFVLVESLIIYFSIRYRRGASPRAAYVKGETARQISWVLVPAAIVLLLDLSIDKAAHGAWEMEKIKMPPADVEVGVEAKQFNWIFVYPGHEGKLGAAGDVPIANELHVPVNKVVRVTLSSRDVIHSFFIPNMRVKQDAEPGRKIQQWFKATKTGTYEIACVELCGFGHYTMRGTVVVQSEQDYQKWLQKNVLAAAGKASK